MIKNIQFQQSLERSVRFFSIFVHHHQCKYNFYVFLMKMDHFTIMKCSFLFLLILSVLKSSLFEITQPSFQLSYTLILCCMIDLFSSISFHLLYCNIKVCLVVRRQPVLFLFLKKSILTFSAFQSVFSPLTDAVIIDIICYGSIILLFVTYFCFSVPPFCFLLG